ncbi:MAG: hypothetical protein KOO60_14690 [Gemmatimonadales bacterium]|nr:hypothetical protein [Gemmatimonadales bacterium]
MNRPVSSIDSWTRRGGMFGGGLILLGGCLPLLKHSMLAGSSVWVWPWALLTQAESMKLIAATATYSTGQNYAPFVFIPLITALLALFIVNTKPLIFRTVGSFVLGTLFLLVMLTGLVAEGEIFGLDFVPPTSGAGLVIMVGVLALATIAACNHLRKRFPTRKFPRVATGVAGGLLTLMSGLSLLAGLPAWSVWSVRLLNVAIIAYGVLAVRMAFMNKPGDGYTRAASLVARGIAVSAPMACLIAQLAVKDPFSNFVIAGGGGFANVFFSIAKCSALYMGGAFLLAFGLAGSMILLLSPEKTQKQKKGVKA